MSTEKIEKVLANTPQGLTDAEKAQARQNIGASDFTGVHAAGPLYGTGTTTDPLVLYTSHGLSLVQNSEDHITRLQVTHPVPAPGSTSTNKVLTCADALENLEWRDPPTGAAIKKKNYGDLEPSDVNTLLIDSDDPEGYTLVKADGVTKGFLVIGPYKGLLDSGVNGVGDSNTAIYIDGNGEFATCSISSGKRRHNAELYFHHTDDGDVYNVRNIKNYCINHVAVQNHNQDICYIHIEAPTLTGDEEYDYTVVFDCTNSAGWVKVSVESADAELFPNPTFHAVPQWLNIVGSDTPSDATLATREIQALDSANNPKYLEIGTAAYASVPPAHQAGPLVLTADSSLYVDDVARTLIKLTGSPQYQVEVLGGRFTIHAF